MKITTTGRTKSDVAKNTVWAGHDKDSVTVRAENDELVLVKRTFHRWPGSKYNDPKGMGERAGYPQTKMYGLTGPNVNAQLLGHYTWPLPIEQVLGESNTWVNDEPDGGEADNDIEIVIMAVEALEPTGTPGEYKIVARSFTVTKGPDVPTDDFTVEDAPEGYPIAHIEDFMIASKHVDLANGTNIVIAHGGDSVTLGISETVSKYATEKKLDSVLADFTLTKTKNSKLEGTETFQLIGNTTKNVQVPSEEGTTNPGIFGWGILKPGFSTQGTYTDYNREVKLDRVLIWDSKSPQTRYSLKIQPTVPQTEADMVFWYWVIGGVVAAIAIAGIGYMAYRSSTSPDTQYTVVEVAQ